MKEKDTPNLLTFILLCMLFLGVTLTYTIFPLLILPIKEDLNIPNSRVGLLYTLMFVTSAAGKFGESFGADWYGKQGFILYSGFLISVGMAGFALSPTYWLICFSVLLVGLGNGLFTPAGYAIVSELYPKQKGKFLGLYQSVFSISALGAYATVTVGSLLGSWRYAVGLVGIYLFIVSTLLYLFYSPQKRVDKSVQRKTSSLFQQMNLAFKKAKNSPVFLKMIMLIIPVSISIKGVESFLPVYLVRIRGLSQGFANLLYMFFMGLILPGKVLFGAAIDRKGFHRTFLFGIGFFLLGLLLFSQIPGFVALVLGLFIVAPPRGGVTTVILTNILGNVSPESADLLNGLYLAGKGVCGSIGPVLVGTLIDSIGFRWSFMALFFFALSTLPVMFHVNNSENTISR